MISMLEITEAPCTANPALFFPDDAYLDDYEEAKAMCAGCPSLTKCSRFAAENKIVHGVWGGQSPRDRGLWEHGKPISEEDFGKYINYAKYFSARQLAEAMGMRTSSLPSMVKKSLLPKPDIVLNSRPFWKKTSINPDLLKETSASL